MTEANQDLDNEPAEATARRRIPGWLVVLGVGLIGAVIYTIPYLQNSLFYYVGDNPESFVPLWHHFGEQLREGQWLTMDPAGWYGGNFAAESAYSLWNPVTLVNYVIVSLFDDLAAAAAVVMIEFLTLTAMGVYLVCREYGARRVPAVVVGLAVPAAGFTLYYEASGWPIGLMSFTWIAWFWWAARRHVRGAMSPLIPFLFGALAMTTGNPYAALGLLILVVALAIELLVGKEFKKLVHVLVMGACVGISGALMFLPLLGAMEVSSRQELAMIANDTFMVPDLGDLAGSSSPTYLPSILNWGGALRENLPSTYFIWFAIPLLPWLRWRSLSHPVRPLLSLVVVTGVYAVLVLGPSNLWLFRWPIRLIEYLYLGLGIFLAVLMSAGLARDRIRQRVLVTAGLVLFGAYLSFAVRPEYWRMHLAAGIAVLALVLAAVFTYHRRGWVAAGAVLLIGSLGVITYQTSRIPVVGPGGIAVEPPRSVSRMEKGTESYQGAVLQLAAQNSVRTQDQDDGEMVFGNLSVATGHESLTRYSGIGFAKFTTALCMDYKGATCPDAFNRLWRPLTATDVALVDALRVDTLVLQNKLLPDVVAKAPKPGWSVRLRDEVRTVWVRDVPISYPGRVSWAQRGTEVRSSDSRPSSEVVQAAVPGQGGELVFARLDWPGYKATIDGREVPVRTRDAGLVAIDLPPGEHRVELTFSSPGLQVGALIMAAAAGIVSIQTVFWWIGRRRDRRTESGRPTTPGDAHNPGDTIEPVLTHAGPKPDAP